MKNQKQLIGILFLVMLITFSSSQEAIPIENCEQLQKMNECLNCSYILTKNIDCSETINWNDGKGFEPIGKLSQEFTGELSSRYETYSINNLYIDRTEDNLGLFGHFNGNIENIEVANAKITGENNLGILIGKSNGGKITNSIVTGEVRGRSRIGGIAGILSNESLIFFSYSNVNLSGERFLGGLAGEIDNSIISKSYSISEIEGSFSEAVGGIAGALTNGSVFQSYSVTEFENHNYSYTEKNNMGFIGKLDEISNTESNFFDRDISKQKKGYGATAKTTNKMKKISTFKNKGWEIISTKIERNNGYPFIPKMTESYTDSWYISYSNSKFEFPLISSLNEKFRNFLEKLFNREKENDHEEKEEKESFWKRIKKRIKPSPEEELDNSEVLYPSELETTSYHSKYEGEAEGLKGVQEWYINYYPNSCQKTRVSSKQKVGIMEVDNDVFFSLKMNDQKTNIEKVFDAKSCSMGICLDMTSLMEISASSPGQIIIGQMNNYTKIEFVRKENLLGINSNCFNIESRINESLQKSYICMHPNYAILMKMESKDSKMKIIELEIRTNAEEIFTPESGQEDEGLFSQMMGIGMEYVNQGVASQTGKEDIEKIRGDWNRDCLTS